MSDRKIRIFVDYHFFKFSSFYWSFTWEGVGVSQRHYPQNTLANSKKFHISSARNRTSDYRKQILTTGQITLFYALRQTIRLTVDRTKLHRNYTIEHFGFCNSLRIDILLTCSSVIFKVFWYVK